jgi:endoglucanase
MKKCLSILLIVFNIFAEIPLSQEDFTLVEAPILEQEGPYPQHPPSQGAIPANRQGISSELQGRFPIHMPTYDGVEQLLVLSNRWVIVVTANLEDVSRELQQLAARDPIFRDHDFLEAQKTWTKSLFDKEYNWTLRRNYIEPVMDKYLVQARENAGERLLDQTDTYAISSATDPSYATARSPSRVTRFIVSRGDEWFSGFDPDYAHYSYLEFPTPMRQGQTYTISLKNGKRVTFLYDELRTVARTIKVNQLGYLPDVNHKYAYLGGYLFEFGSLDFASLVGKEFSVINAHTGARQLTGKVALREANPRYENGEPMSGEDVYQLDISALKTPGVYFISVPGVGRSWPFKVASGIYGEAFYTLMRGMFAQRCGVPLTQEFSAWTRKQCHTEPAYESECVSVSPEMDAPNFETFDVIGATIDYAKSTPGPVYGWHDAADWDKSPDHYIPLLAMLTLYEMVPQKFRDGQLHLPPVPEQQIGGSGDGIPDILDEAEFGLTVWTKSMTQEGGCSGMWETWTHPRIDDPDFHYAYGVRMQWVSLLYATAAAQFAYLIKPFDAVKAAMYEAAARKAYAYGTSPQFFQKTFTMHAKTDRGKGKPYTIVIEDRKDYHIPYLASAKLRLYLLTKDKQFLKDLPSLLDQAIEKMGNTGSYISYLQLIYYGVFNREMTGQIPEPLRRKLALVYLKGADALVHDSQHDPYRRAKARSNIDLAWGWGVMTNRARWLLIANHLAPSPTYKETALFNADYQMGTNPQGMSWITSIGYVYPIHLQHGISETDQILDPFPGIQLYGPTPSGWRMISQIWMPKENGKTAVDAAGKPIIFLPPGNCDRDYIRLPPPLRRYATHPALLVDQNEFTIAQTLAGALFTFGMLMDDGWMPSEELKQRKPRADHLLFGYWYTP